MASESGEVEYSIAAVSRLTGASCHALRAWERRYGFPVPQRSASGHRRYAQSHVQAIQAITELARTGRPIGALIAELRAGRLPQSKPQAAGRALERESAIGALVGILNAGDVRGGEAEYQRLTAALSPAETVSRVIGPAWIEAGERWFRHECAVYQARTVNQFMIRKLEVLIEEAESSNAHPAHTLVAGTVQGDRHWGGVLMLNVFLELAGWRVINLGVDLPIREYLAAVKNWRPDALALSFVLSRNIRRRFQELEAIRGVPVFVGGRTILNYQALARRHGLIPLPGPIDNAVEHLSLEFERWITEDKPRTHP